MKLSGVGVRRLLLARTDDDVDKSSVVNDALARSSLWAFLLLLLGNYWFEREVRKLDVSKARYDARDGRE
jgi:hypothetical protein